MIFKTMTDEYWESLPDDKKWCVYEPSNGKYWQSFTNDNKPIGFVGCTLDNKNNKAFIQLYIEVMYRKTPYLKYMLSFIKKEFKDYDLFASVSKNNKISLKVCSVLYYYDSENEEIVFFKVRDKLN